MRIQPGDQRHVFHNKNKETQVNCKRRKSRMSHLSQKTHSERRFGKNKKEQTIIWTRKLRGWAKDGLNNAQQHMQVR